MTNFIYCFGPKIHQGVDAAVGDMQIMANRYNYAEFSQPYVESHL